MPYHIISSCTLYEIVQLFFNVWLITCSQLTLSLHFAFNTYNHLAFLLGSGHPDLYEGLRQKLKEACQKIIPVPTASSDR